MPSSYMACAWNLKQAKDWLAQGIFPGVACTSQILPQYTRNVNMGVQPAACAVDACHHMPTMMRTSRFQETHLSPVTMHR